MGINTVTHYFSICRKINDWGILNYTWEICKTPPPRDQGSLWRRLKTLRTGGSGHLQWNSINWRWQTVTQINLQCCDYICESLILPFYPYIFIWKCLLQRVIGLVRGLWFLLNNRYWTLIGTPLKYPVVVLCYGDPSSLVLQDQSCHMLQQFINTVDVGWANLYLWLWAWVIAGLVSLSTLPNLHYQGELTLWHIKTVKIPAWTGSDFVCPILTNKVLGIDNRWGRKCKFSLEMLEIKLRS